jgi:hypothetical protein
MTMKRTELEKRQGLTIANAQRRAGNAYGPSRTAPPDRKAQREADRAAGRVPFAVKLPAELSEALRQQAQAQGVRLDDLVAELLRAGLGR